MFWAGILGMVGTVITGWDPVVFWLCFAMTVLGGLAWLRLGSGDSE